MVLGIMVSGIQFSHEAAVWPQIFLIFRLNLGTSSLASMGEMPMPRATGILPVSPSASASFGHSRFGLLHGRRRELCQLPQHLFQIVASRSDFHFHLQGEKRHSGDFVALDFHQVFVRAE